MWGGWISGAQLTQLELAAPCTPATSPGSVGFACGLRGGRVGDRNRRTFLQIVNALLENTLELGERFLVAAQYFRKLQLTEDGGERGYEPLGV